MNHNLFDRTALRRTRKRSLLIPGDYSFLKNHACASITERLSDVKRDFPLCLFIGERNPETENTKKIGNITICDMGRKSDIEADEEFLPFAKNCFDICISNLMLHSVNDIPGTLLQINRSLKPDSFFIVSLFGFTTLWELQESMTKAENEIGISPHQHIHPFPDKKQMGDLMTRTGFRMPVIDSEKVTVMYNDTYSLFKDLRGMGETNVLTNRNRHFSRKTLFTKTDEIYKQNHTEREADNHIPATFEIMYVAGWKAS